MVPKHLIKLALVDGIAEVQSMNKHSRSGNKTIVIPFKNKNGAHNIVGRQNDKTGAAKWKKVAVAWGYQCIGTHRDHGDII